MTDPATSTSVRTSVESHIAQYDRLGDEPLSVTIANAVATVSGEEVTDLDPLHYAIDADALERLFEPRADGVRSAGQVRFQYNGCTVTVTADGEVRVAPSAID